jgi:polyisoprenoid-binding protein YceI
MMAKVRGRFTEFTAAIVIAEDPEQSAAEVELDVNSVTTRDERRDAHLRSPDYFDDEKFPKISFRSLALRPGKDDTTWELDGDLTILDVTRPVTWTLEFHGATQDPWGGQRAAHRFRPCPARRAGHVASQPSSGSPT